MAIKKLKDEKTFWKTEISPKIKFRIKITYISAYITSLVTFMLAFSISTFMVIDAILVFISGLGIHYKKSRVCACILTTEFFASKILLLINGYPASSFIIGILYLIIYISGTVAAFQYQEHWDSFLKSEPDIEEEDIDIDLDDLIGYFNIETQGNQSQETE